VGAWPLFGLEETVPPPAEVEVVEVIGPQPALRRGMPSGSRRVTPFPPTERADLMNCTSST
jgi:hypothetical protein